MITHQLLEPDFCVNGHLIGWTQVRDYLDSILTNSSFQSCLFIIPYKFVLHDVNRVLAPSFTDDELHDFQRLIVPLMSTPRVNAAHDDGPLVVQVLPNDIPSLLDIIRDGNYDQDCGGLWLASPRSQLSLMGIVLLVVSKFTFTVTTSPVFQSDSSL